MAGRHKLGKAGKGKEEVGSLAQSGLGGHPCAGTIRGQLERLSDKADWEHYTVGSTQGSWMSSQKVLPSDSAPSPNLQSVSQSVQSLSRVRLFATPWTAAYQASLSITNSRSLLKLIFIE